jgi:hypothetical protein
MQGFDGNDEDGSVGTEEKDKDNACYTCGGNGHIAGNNIFMIFMLFFHVGLSDVSVTQGLQ